LNNSPTLFDVLLVLDRAREAGQVMADRLQLEQVVMNLALNARDAMPEEGELRITTRGVVLDAAAAHHYGGLAPGSYCG
jgi:two-component system cell cycle sensor histidine kinase/response regulator CckA